MGLNVMMMRNIYGNVLYLDYAILITGLLALPLKLLYIFIIRKYKVTNGGPLCAKNALRRYALLQGVCMPGVGFAVTFGFSLFLMITADDGEDNFLAFVLLFLWFFASVFLYFPFACAAAATAAFSLTGECGKELPNDATAASVTATAV